MTIDYKHDVSPVIDTVLGVAGAASGHLTGTAGVVVSLVVAGLKYANDLIAAGIQDPLTHIERVHAADPALADVENAWAEALRTKFGPKP